MSSLEALHNRIDLVNIPFTERGSRILLMLREDALFFRLAERWVKWEGKVGHYRQRPPIIEHFTYLDADGVKQALVTDTYPHRAGILTSAGRFDWVFLDAEAILSTLPAGRYGFEFIVHAEQGVCDRRGGMLRGKRNVAYTTDAKIISNEVTPISEELMRVRLMVEARDGDGLLINITPRLAYNRSIPKGESAIRAAEMSWEAWFGAAPPVLDQYREQYLYAWWVMRMGLLNTRYYFTREAMTPSKIHYVGVWQWDQFFHALAYRHVDAKLAEDQIRIVLDHQREDGLIPDAIHDEGTITHLTAPVDEDVTKPPLAGWAVLKIYEATGHLDFLEEVYEPLTRWHNWWLTRSANKSGLAEYRHPFSSGLDDSPLWDDGTPVVAPDLNTYLCLQAENLARIAELIGQPEEAAAHRERANVIARGMLDRMWNPAKGWFDALHLGEKPINVATPFQLLPLMTGRMPDSINAKLIANLTNPNTFWTEYPLATVAANDPKFDPMQMWRGPTWVNINYLFVEALQRVGSHVLAGELRRETLNLIMRHNDIYEYYNPITAEKPPKSAPIFGWTSAVFIDLAIQETRAQQGK